MCIDAAFKRYRTVSEKRAIRAWKRFNKRQGGKTVLRATNSSIEYSRGISYGPAGYGEHLEHTDRLTRRELGRNGSDVGFHALKNFDDQPYGNVSLRVKLWGLIAEHKTGYRAEYFRIVPLTAAEKGKLKAAAAARRKRIRRV